ncbi:MAG TPA: divalent metal cation transporter [Acetobacteraceae bacterium]|nr:divalent metal cation transporter [Acetobacteraceae bacterium]
MSPMSEPGAAAATVDLAPRVSWRLLAATVGPALVVMLADTEAGSVIAAAQSGAEWGYRLVLPQFMLTPALFMAQELAGRLGLSTRQGLAQLVLNRLGRLPAVILLATLAVSCFGALVTELSGIAGVGELFGIPVWQSSAVAAAGLLAIVWTGSYRSMELIAIAVGMCELAFIVLAWLAHPSGHELLTQSVQVPLHDRSYLYLLAANLGTCVIPWAVFYQQSASIDKGLTRAHLTTMRVETLAGAILCQTVTAAVVIAAAAAFGHSGGAGQSFDKVGDIADAFASTVGPTAGRVVFAVGLSGGALVAAIVVCLTLAWSFGEVVGLRHSLSESPARAPWFYGAFTAVVVAGAAVVGSGLNLVQLAVAAGVLNAVLLPVVLGFLWHMARRELPAELRLRGAYAVAVGAVLLLTASVGFYAGVVGSL